MVNSTIVIDNSMSVFQQMGFTGADAHSPERIEMYPLGGMSLQFIVYPTTGA